MVLMDASQRLSELVEVLRRDGRVDVATAAAEFGTAELTIRRDLDVLVERGVARRVRGGAVNLLMRGEELPYAMREIELTGSKRRIAAAVAGLIADGEAVGLDSGTTVAETARALADRRLTVLPLSLHAAMALAGSPSVRLMLPGGEARPGELAMVGPLALAGIAALRFDTVVLGCCGVSPEGHVMAHDLGTPPSSRRCWPPAAAACSPWTGPSSVGERWRWSANWPRSTWWSPTTVPRPRRWPRCGPRG